MREKKKKKGGGIKIGTCVEEIAWEKKKRTYG